MSEELNRDQLLSVLFAEMVMQQTNMALIFLGKTPHPQTGKTVHDLNAARLFIDQLEMLESKTKGNLSAEEESLLKRSLGHLRLTYVEIANQKTQESPKSTESPRNEDAQGSEAGAAEDEPRKRFTKKY